MKIQVTPATYQKIQVTPATYRFDINVSEDYDDHTVVKAEANLTELEVEALILSLLTALPKSRATAILSEYSATRCNS